MAEEAAGWTGHGITKLSTLQAAMEILHKDEGVGGGEEISIFNAYIFVLSFIMGSGGDL